MKMYNFTVINLKNNSSFCLHKRFPSAYSADCWAMRVSYKKKNSPYLVILTA